MLFSCSIDSLFPFQEILKPCAAKLAITQAQEGLARRWHILLDSVSSLWPLGFGGATLASEKVSLASRMLHVSPSSLQSWYKGSLAAYFGAK